VLIDEIEQALGLASSTALRYVDPQRGQRRCAQLDTSLDSNSSVLQGFLLAGDTQSATWMSTMLTQQIPAQVPAQTFRRQLLMPGGSPPAAMPESMHLASQQICNCLDVSASAIKEHLVSCKGSPQDRLTSLQKQLGCGTQCGSCVPELKRLISISP
jgi:assimilatory nitrate reductase catalytic subunit